MKKRLYRCGLIIFLLVFAAGAVCAQAEEPDDSPVTVSEPPAVQSAPEYKNYTTGERWGTWALNYFVFPGLGSFMVMKDTTGGIIQMAVGGVGDVLITTYGIILFSAYYDVWKTFDEDFHNNDDDDPAQLNLNPIWDAARKYLGLVIAGAALGTASTVFNIIRSATYDRPQPKVGSLADINAWSLAVLPGENGVEQVQLAYTLRF
jgi:hypothetical protein